MLADLSYITISEYENILCTKGVSEHSINNSITTWSILINVSVESWSRVNSFLQTCHWVSIDTFKMVGIQPTID